jgi:hypothetical protein
LGLRTHYFHWAYAPVISLGLRTRYFHWVYAPVIFIGFTHPLSPIFGYTHPLSSILGFTHPLFSLGLHTLIFIGFTHPLSSSFWVFTHPLPFTWVYAPITFLSLGVYTPYFFHLGLCTLHSLLVYRPFIHSGLPSTIYLGLRTCDLYWCTHPSSLFGFTHPFIFCPGFIHPVPSVF